MQYQSDNTDISRSWNEQEIKELILYAKSLQQQNEELQAKMIAMDAYVKNADAKIRKLTMLLSQYIPM
jgi:F0F1-type ATP synthase gamma subunit